MMPNEKWRTRVKFFRKTDGLVVLAVVLIAAGIFFLRRPLSQVPAVAELTLGNKLLQTLPLDTGEARAFSVPERPDVVFKLDGKGGIRFLSSNCPDKVCVNAGRLHLAGQSAACLPNELFVRIVPLGEANSAPDFIAG